MRPADCLLLVRHQGMSASRQLVDWKAVQGAFHKPRRLHLKCHKDELFRCPLLNCEHEGFASQRGCRKHVKTKHSWYIYFDPKPKISNDDETNADVKELFVGKRTNAAMLGCQLSIRTIIFGLASKYNRQWKESEASRNLSDSSI